jgi:hypothetical protein
MAEQITIVCDVCGDPATSGVVIEVRTGTGKGRKSAQDLCATHMSSLLARGHAPRRGRRRGDASATAVAKPAAAKPAAKTATASAPAKKPRKPITDPAILEKRRAALAKARAARAAKRAAASA